MNSGIIIKSLGRKALASALLGALAIGLMSLSLSNCFAGQTVNVPVTSNLQALVTQYPGSTTFSLAPGIHRLQTVIPKSGDAFVGQTGAIMSGAILLTTFTQSGAYWTTPVTNITKAGSYVGQCISTHPACMYPEDLFFNSVPKQRVTSLAGVKPGTWYLNYSNNTAYMGDNPAGYTVELSVLPLAFTGAAPSVSISNLTIEKYATPSQYGAINGAGGGMWWSVQGNVVRYNHAVGISTGNGMYVYNNNVNNNGQLGIGGGGNNFTVQSNQVSYNGYAGYSYYWEAGGIKFANAQNAMANYNYSHHNGGPGFWSDVNSQYITFANNQATANIEAGIFSEISTNITIKNNYVWSDGFNPDGTGVWWGAGILVADSTNITIYSNNVSSCMNGIVGILSNRGNAPSGQPYVLENVDVSGNTITQATGMVGGIVIEGTGFDNSVFTSWNNTFLNNTFVLGTPTGKYFNWMGQTLTLTGLTALL